MIEPHLIRQLAGAGATRSGGAAGKAHAPSAEPGRFRALLDEKLGATGAAASGELKFSKHAQARLASRNIELSTEDMGKLGRAVDSARQKGSRDSLVLLNDLAFVVSVKNNTVITAVNDGSIRENVFTNIDSAVIAR